MIRTIRRLRARPVDDCLPEVRAARDLKGLKLGLPKQYFVEGLDPEIEKLTRAAVEQCRELGAEIVDVDLPHSQYGIACYYILAPAEASANLARYDGVRYGFRAEADDLLEMYEKTRARRLRRGGEAAHHFGHLRAEQRLSRCVLSARAEGADADPPRFRDRRLPNATRSSGPVTPTAAFRVGEKSADPVQMYLGDIFTVNVNLAGICGLSVPCGFTASGLPAGLHVVGPAFEETRILKSAPRTSTRRTGT